MFWGFVTYMYIQVVAFAEVAWGLGERTAAARAEVELADTKGSIAPLMRVPPNPKGVGAPQWGCHQWVPMGPGASVGGNRYPFCWVPALSPGVPGEALEGRVGGGGG